MADKTHRDAITGEFVTAEHAAANPDTTVSESRDQPEPVVRTVGDLTARHLATRIRIGLIGSAGVLTDMQPGCIQPGTVSIAWGGTRWNACPLDTPCEVLP